ncbi:MAG: type III-A CRISPR-associated RAMP protein Csm3, partial [Bacteroidota bacterium]
MADQPPSIEDLQRIGHLTKKIRLRGYITTRTGLHIGGTNARLSIGGTDATVVRNPFTNQPYIPGSSLKGKMRSLIERLEGKFSKIGGLADAGPYMDDPSHPICKVFGLLPERLPKSKPQPISQLIVRDAHLSKKSRQRLNENAGLDMPFTEVKTEVVLDRITAQAVPRQ